MCVHGVWCVYYYIYILKSSYLSYPDALKLNTGKGFLRVTEKIKTVTFSYPVTQNIKTHDRRPNTG